MSFLLTINDNARYVRQNCGIENCKNAYVLQNCLLSFYRILPSCRHFFLDLKVEVRIAKLISSRLHLS